MKLTEFNRELGTIIENVVREEVEKSMKLEEIKNITVLGSGITGSLLFSSGTTSDGATGSMGLFVGNALGGAVDRTVNVVRGAFATVVIGGVVTSTALTLIVLPTMYAWFGGAPTQPTDDPAPATASERDAE